MASCPEARGVSVSMPLCDQISTGFVEGEKYIFIMENFKHRQEES